MAKIKLKITHIIGESENISYVMGIKENNKINYLDDQALVTLNFTDNCVKIKRVNVTKNYMQFGSDSYGYFVIDNKKIHYEIKTNKLLIDKKKIEIEYVIETMNKYILEVVDDGKIKTSN